ncbi:hypothetical protein [Brevibacillus borstelensis]|uniref:hypothetical protein n=1 Tax=Brevibacillus borstelensis TaxID=45462 RepID=UPI001D0A6B78|nr:hypothetical protein [Brevibacillus borstelensis]MCC0567175.1 hypothetical protein [Brevibacillus borstelensis]
MNKRNRSISEGLSIHTLMGATRQKDVSQTSLTSDNDALLEPTEIPDRKNIPKSKESDKPKLSHPEKTKHNEDLIQQGKEILAAMSKEEIDLLGSKSGTLHFVHLLGLASKKTNRSIGGVNNRTYKDSSTPVGITLRSDIDIEVPVIDVLKNKDTGIDLEEDISDIWVKAGEEFHLTYYEFMFLILRDEYAGFFEANGNPSGAHLSIKSPAFMSKKVKLPTPTINFTKGTGSIKACMIDIDEKSPDGTWVIKSGYEKFAPLVHNGKRRKRPSKKDIGTANDYPVPTLIASALQEELGLSGTPVKNRSTSEEALLNRGKEIINAMTENRKKNLGSKSGTLHFVHSLGYPNKRGISKPIGVTLKSDEDIQVPVIDIKKDNETGINPVNDITYRTVPAGEEFDVSLYEFMYLIIQDEYAGYFWVDGNNRGAFFSPRLSLYLNGEKKLPVPNIEFDKKCNINIDMVDIYQTARTGGVEVKPQYAAKFGALFE